MGADRRQALGQHLEDLAGGEQPAHRLRARFRQARALLGRQGQRPRDGVVVDAAAEPFAPRLVQQVRPRPGRAVEHQQAQRGGELQWLFPYVPELVGAEPPTLVLGKYSGMANVEWALERLPVTVPAERRAALLAEVKAEGIRLHRTLTEADFAATAREFADLPNRADPAMS